MQETTGRPPTIRDVAKYAHVGVMTVSRVINQHPMVRPSTLKKVNAAIAALGYQKNEAARLMKGQRAMMIGLIVPDLSDMFFAACAQTVQHVARSHGYMTLVAASERDPKLEMQQAELMASRKISGLLVVTSTTGDDQGLQQLKRTGLAIVAFDRPLSGMQTDAVVVENRYGAEEAVRHLIKHGHKRIACAGYDEKTFAVRERIEGYTSCMNAAGLKPEVVLGVETQERTRAWLEKAMIQKGHPTAIFALNHRVSTFLLTALAEMKIAIPEKVALIGFDDFDLASIVSPPLTTITQSPTQLSKRAMALLIERIEDQSQKRESMPAKVVLPVSLTIRASCGCTPDKQV